mmetsp:Transcript_25303/g.99932  ORF Transcript_25303/g.99932 Transcript_25303/m.99932 type:complete len:102 (-) Transcript_25303:1067-1372(-)
MRGSRLRYLADLSSASKSQHGYADSHLDQHFTSASYRNATLEVVSAATTSVDLSIVNDQQEFTASIIVLDERAKWPVRYSAVQRPLIDRLILRRTQSCALP